MNNADTALIDFLAWRIYADDCARRKTIPALWLALRDEIRFDCIARAKKQYVTWVKEERDAEVRRRA